jgi:hypothetical protein
MLIYYFCFEFSVSLISYCSFYSVNITLQLLWISYCGRINSNSDCGKQRGLWLSEGQRGIRVCFSIKQCNQTSPPTTSTHCSCRLHAVTTQKSILGVQAPAILFSSKERERMCSDVVRSRAWPLGTLTPAPPGPHLFAAVPRPQSTGGHTACAR